MDDRLNLTLPEPLIPPAHPVHERPLPRWRVIYEFFRNPLTTYSHEAFERTFHRMRGLGVDTVGIADSEAITHVMTVNQANYRRPVVQPRLFRPIMGFGLFLAEGEDWRRQRKMLSPVFRPSALNGLIPHFTQAAQAMTERLEGRDATAFTEVFHRSTLDAVLRALFSLSADDNRSNMTNMVREFLDTAGRPNLFDALATQEGDFGWAMKPRKAFQTSWLKAVDEVIAARKASDDVDRSDLLSLLLNARDEAGSPLPDSEIRDQCSTLLAAGFETTSRLLFWTSYLLALDPAEQTRIRAEVKAFPVDRVQTLEDLNHWPRLKCALLEALRLYPPVAYIVRKAIKDDVLAGQPIAAGTEVWMSPFVIHRHRKFWDNPTAFMPDRFAGIASPWTSLPHYMPFGAGPRICIGAAFAVVEAQIIMAALLSRFEPSLQDTRPVLPVFRLATVPNHDPVFSLKAA